jgi:hypothetical protein
VRALFVFAALVAGCSVYDASLLGSDAGAPGTGGQGGGGGEGGAGGTDGAGCTFAKPPDQPTAGSSGGSIELVAAMKTVDLGEAKGPDKPTYTGIGFDLDHACTTADPATSSCREPEFATANHADGPGGRDNAVGALVDKVHSTLGDAFGSQTYNDTIAQGNASILVRVRGWNGEPDDADVEVSLYVADVLGTSPAWDGDDAWPVRSDSLVPSGDPTQASSYDIERPKYADPHGYVSGGKLVASLAHASILLTNALFPGKSTPISLNLDGAFLVGTIEGPNGGRYLSDVTLAGVWPTNDLVHQLGHFPDPINRNTSLCMTSAVSYPTFRDQVCSFTDIYDGPQATKVTPCNGLSFAIQLQTAPAKIGPISVVVPEPNPCPACADPQNDSCENPVDTTKLNCP